MEGRLCDFNARSFSWHAAQRVQCSPFISLGITDDLLTDQNIEPALHSAHDRPHALDRFLFLNLKALAAAEVIQLNFALDMNQSRALVSSLSLVPWHVAYWLPSY